MPIVASDIQLQLSGGAANANPNASLGGAISANAVGAGLHNLFDVVNGAEAAAGDVEYRCIYVRNGHATLTWYGAVVYISSNTPSTGTDAAIGVGTSAINDTEQTVANENTAPTGVTFSQPTTAATGLALGDIPPGGHKAIWVRRTVSAGAAAYNNDGVTLAFQGDTEA